MRMAEARQQIAGSADLPLAQDAQGRLIIAGSVSGGIEKGRIFNTAIGAAANFFAADLEPTNSPTTFRIYICLDTDGTLSVQRTSPPAPPVTVAEELNQGIALEADAAYMFDILVHEDDTINLQTSVVAQILYCLVVEL
ncbi:unnamed protein product [marine sediment metagenome]|uniref:Uncharacterized protein n=1 Tax=marine sediment metagenome TaxID=412755 RepID=X1T8P7_9ZZZZ